MIQLSLPVESLGSYILKILTTHVPVGKEYCEHDFCVVLRKSLERLTYCFRHIHRKYYSENNKVVFNHFNSDHMATLLYFLSNTVWQENNDEALATRLFYLNKIMHGIDLFYSVNMPDIFMLVHPLGTILGKASYQNFLVVYQNVTVGAEDVLYPRFEEGVILYAKSSILGDCNIGKNVIFGANSFLMNIDVPDDTVVLGQYPQHRMIKNRHSVLLNFFERDRCKTDSIVV